MVDARRNSPKKKNGLTGIRKPPSSPGKQVHERLSQLEAQVERLGSAFDQNTGVFTESFKMNEGISVSMQKVMGEVARGQKLTYALEDGTPDWMAYLRYYWLCMVMADFVSWLKSLGTEEKESSTIVLPTQEETQTIIFGG